MVIRVLDESELSEEDHRLRAEMAAEARALIRQRLERRAHTHTFTLWRRRPSQITYQDRQIPGMPLETRRVYGHWLPWKARQEQQGQAERSSGRRRR